MPYIKSQQRELYIDEIDEILDCLPYQFSVSFSGELAYVLYSICKRSLGSDYNFDLINKVIGVLDNIKGEIKRQILFPYEEVRRKENGDI